MVVMISATMIILMIDIDDHNNPSDSKHDIEKRIVVTIIVIVKMS